ncbi:PPOX class F420-dependent oxidoreductase [Amycolatopsis sp. NPDC051903]|uniref:PPOX class F420-dependent oxidoreductase n=1 Tax=Amycolatopsis sp. NPDC051903 TaxID=3363936 RepID=UPI00379A08D7
MFTPAEIEYLTTQDLGRLATQQPDGTLQVNPVAFTYNPSIPSLDITGAGLAASRKYRNAAANHRAAFVVDDRPSLDPMRVRFLEVRGRAEVLPAAFEPDGHLDGAVIRIHPERILSFGIDDPDKPPMETRSNNRDVVR